MDGIATHVYDESGPVRYVYDEKQYAELVKSGNTLRDAVANKNLKSVTPALKEVEAFYSNENSLFRRQKIYCRCYYL